jgi:hypothetical protein
VALAVHIFGAVIWVGGMFAIYVCLRPALGTLDPPQRLRLMRVTFQKFFLWVWVAILLLLASGYWIVFMRFGGFSGAGLQAVWVPPSPGDGAPCNSYSDYPMLIGLSKWCHNRLLPAQRFRSPRRRARTGARAPTSLGGSAHRRGHLILKQPKTVRCANLTVEARRPPSGRLIPVGSRMTCTALTVATRI